MMFAVSYGTHTSYFSCYSLVQPGRQKPHSEDVGSGFFSMQSFFFFLSYHYTMYLGAELLSEQGAHTFP